MKYVILVLLLVGCSQDMSTQLIAQRDDAVSTADKAIKVAERAVGVAEKWKEKYCNTSEGKIDLETCQED